jgi:aryl-alcohol dehydrogenase-like predicted oxidoreductase
VQAWFAHCRDEGVTPLAAALAHVKALPWCDEVVIGVADASQLEQIINAWSRVEACRAPVSLGSEDLALIDPRTWQVAS